MSRIGDFWLDKIRLLWYFLLSDRTTTEPITRLKSWESFSWSLSSPTPVEGHSSIVSAVAFSPDEKSLKVSGGSAQLLGL
jgi:hypothetical protein